MLARCRDYALGSGLGRSLARSPLGRFLCCLPGEDEMAQLADGEELYPLHGLRSVRSARMGPCDGPLQHTQSEPTVGRCSKPTSCPLGPAPTRTEGAGAGRATRSESDPRPASYTFDL